LSRLALGTVQFGLNYGISNTHGQTGFDEVKKILQKAAQLGIDTLDTARGYGDSEQVIGNCNSKSFKIVSKFPGTVHSIEELKVSLKMSLLNLQTGSLYAYMAHDADALLKNPVLWESLKELKEAGAVQKIGYSLYNPDQLQQLLQMKCLPGIVQLPYNFIDRRFEKYFPLLKSLDCEVHVRSVFLQGLFFLQPASLTTFFEPVKPLLLLLRERFKSENEIAGFLMNFILRTSSIDKLVFGVNTLAQLEENISNLQLTAAEKQFNWDEPVPLDILMPNKWPKQIFAHE